MKKILLIDDDEDLSEVVGSVLHAQGYTVYTHSAALNVHQIVNRYAPDLILMDIMMYGKSGTEVCEEFKEMYTIPVILFSADTAKGKAFKEYNADGYIEKPFEIRDLISTVKLFLEESAVQV